MNNTTPHLIQYQGSKRKLAPQIIPSIPEHTTKVVEPFAGMAAVSIAFAMINKKCEFHLNDVNRPLIQLFEEAVEQPERLYESYKMVWDGQFDKNVSSEKHYYKIRDDFNNGNQQPAMMLYLLARCVKGAVRYGKDGKFNQSPDKRRNGTKPVTILMNAVKISRLLKGRTTFSSLDYREVLKDIGQSDFVYMDPPYQGVSNVRDNRYLSGVPLQDFIEAISELNEKGIHYIISYDGHCGNKTYGEELPDYLGCKRIVLDAGRSSQSTLLGRDDITKESLYLSPSLSFLNSDIQLSIEDFLYV